MITASFLLATLAFELASADYTIPVHHKHHEGGRRLTDYSIPLPHKPKPHGGGRSLLTPEERNLVAPQECLGNEDFSSLACIDWPNSGVTTFFDSCSGITVTEDLFRSGACQGCHIAVGTDPNFPGPTCEGCDICTMQEDVAWQCETLSSLPVGMADCMTCDGSTTCCTDEPGWVDADGDGCAWYAAGADRCSTFGTCCTNGGMTANDACCVCGGGIGEPASSPPTEPPTTPTEPPSTPPLTEPPTTPPPTELPSTPPPTELPTTPPPTPPPTDERNDPTPVPTSGQTLFPAPTPSPDEGTSSATIWNMVGASVICAVVSIGFILG